MSLDVLRERLRAERSLKLSVKAIPKASRDEVSGILDDGTLKVKVTAPPEDGKANVAICALLADEFGVPSSNVRVLRGHTNRNKIVEVVTAR